MIWVILEGFFFMISLLSILANTHSFADWTFVIAMPIGIVLHILAYMSNRRKERQKMEDNLLELSEKMTKQKPGNPQSGTV